MIEWRSLHLPGYTEDEKVQIASRFLVPKQLETHGLAGYKIQMSRRSNPSHYQTLHTGSWRAQSGT